MSEIFIVLGWWDHEEGKRHLREHFDAKYSDYLVWGVYGTRRAAENAARVATTDGDIEWQVVRLDAGDVHCDLKRATRDHHA